MSSIRQCICVTVLFFVIGCKKHAEIPPGLVAQKSDQRTTPGRHCFVGAGTEISRCVEIWWQTGEKRFAMNSGDFHRPLGPSGDTQAINIDSLVEKMEHSKLLQGLVLIGGFEWSKELNVSVERGTRSLNDDEWNELLKKLIAKGYEVDEKRQDLW